MAPPSRGSRPHEGMYPVPRNENHDTTVGVDCVCTRCEVTRVNAFKPHSSPAEQAVFSLLALVPLGRGPCRCTNTCPSFNILRTLDALFASEFGSSLCLLFVCSVSFQISPLPSELFACHVCASSDLLEDPLSAGSEAGRRIRPRLVGKQAQRGEATCLRWLSLGGVSGDPTRVRRPRLQRVPPLQGPPFTGGAAGPGGGGGFGQRGAL